MEETQVVRIHPEYEEVVPLPPAQFNIFTREPEPVRVEIDREPEDGQEVQIAEGISMVKSADASSVILSGFGLYVGKKSERLVVKTGKKIVYEFPFFRLNEVIISSKGISVSSDAIRALCEQGIRLSFISGNGSPYAMITSPMLSATVQTRRAQILAFSDAKGVAFAKLIVAGKLKNQSRLLRYFGKYVSKIDQVRFQKLTEVAKSLEGMKRQIADVRGTNLDEARGTLMGLEGTAGRIYWEAVKTIIGERATFLGRERRGAVDAVNSLLNYGYGILYSTVWGAVLNAGLEPFAGFLHVDRPGKPSLVLDLVEEFRQPVVDRTVISHVNLGEAVKMEGGMLAEETRRYFAGKILERLESLETVKGKKYQVKSIIQMQARSLAMFLREKGEYKPFSFKW